MGATRDFAALTPGQATQHAHARTGFRRGPRADPVRRLRRQRQPVHRHPEAGPVPHERSGPVADLARTAPADPPARPSAVAHERASADPPARPPAVAHRHPDSPAEHVARAAPAVDIAGPTRSEHLASAAPAVDVARQAMAGRHPDRALTERAELSADVVSSVPTGSTGPAGSTR
jgi:hypothetical protein